MTDRKEIEMLAAKARGKGAIVVIQNDMNGYIKTVQVLGLKGCGPYPMSVISAAERLRELV